MGYEYEVRERIYLTSNKRAVVPESDKRAAFLLAHIGPVDMVKEKEIRSFRGGANFLHEIGSPKASQPEGDTAGEPEADKGGQPDADKGGQPQGDTSGQAEGDKGVPGPYHVIDFGKYEGTPVRELLEKYLKNLTRVSNQHRPMAQAELARRAEEAD